jgi:beta-phosphoglucomutase family hydrolase
MNKIAAIFDMDGVIVDSNPHHKISLDQFFEKYGLSVTEEELHEKLYGRRNQEWIPLIFNKALTEEEIEAYAYEKEALFREIYQYDIVALAGLENFLKLLQEADIPCAVGTSAPVENADFVLEKTGLGKYFKAVLHSKHVSIGKPHPDIYLKAAETLGFAPENCVVFEDSLPGVEAGLRAGTKVVGVATTHSAQELNSTHLVINDFNELNPDSLYKLF